MSIYTSCRYQEDTVLFLQAYRIHFDKISKLALIYQITDKYRRLPIPFSNLPCLMLFANSFPFYSMFALFVHNNRIWFLLVFYIIENIYSNHPFSGKMCPNQLRFHFFSHFYLVLFLQSIFLSHFLVFCVFSVLIFWHFQLDSRFSLH